MTTDTTTPSAPIGVSPTDLLIVLQEYKHGLSGDDLMLVPDEVDYLIDLVEKDING